MKWSLIRILVFIAALIGAVYYRFPVEIQKLKIEAAAFINDNIMKAKGSMETEDVSSTAEKKPILGKLKVVIVELRNKGKIEGIIKNARGKDVVIDIGGGSIGIPKKDIKRIRIPLDDERAVIMENLGKSEGASEEAGKVTEISYSDKDRIIVRALLNDKIRVNLILDTGAPYVSITPGIASQLFDINKVPTKNVDMKWSDGSTTDGKLVLLESVSVGAAKIKNVKAVVSQISVLDSGTDGLLGLSFLNDFTLNIDAGRKRVILKKK